MCGISTASSARRALSDAIKKKSLIASKDCDTVAASGLFSIDSPDGKQAPLCELLQVQSGIEGKLFHGMQCVAFHSSLHLIR